MTTQWQKLTERSARFRTCIRAAKRKASYLLTVASGVLVTYMYAAFQLVASRPAAVAGALLVPASYAIAADCYQPTNGYFCNTKLTDPNQTPSSPGGCTFLHWMTIYDSLGDPIHTGSGNYYTYGNSCYAVFRCYDTNNDAYDTNANPVGMANGFKAYYVHGSGPCSPAGSGT